MSISDKYKYSGLTSKIIGCAMEVHRHLGNGFQGVVYQRALAVELGLQGIDFKRVMNKKSKPSSNQTNQSSGLLAGKVGGQLLGTR